ncbi:MAG: universal stress protein, partial [Solirubrobacterales bacterium]
SVGAEVRLVRGALAGGVLAAASELDLLVLGARDSYGRARGRLGSFAAQVAREASCPVLFVAS